MRVRRICVFCASSPGSRPGYVGAARTLGHLLAERGLGLVYGGASVGLMGTVASAVLEAGGEAVGVIPHLLDGREITHRGLTELHVVASMHERKKLMFDLSDGFVSLPGGLGTLEETFEMATWAQLGLHPHPVGLLDVEGFYQPLVSFLDRAVEERLLKPEHRAILVVEQEPAALLDRIDAWEPPRVVKWIDGAAT